MAASATLRARSTSPSSQATGEKAALLPEETGYVNGRKYGGTNAADPNSGTQGINIPMFTVKELLGAIPAHCFKRSAIKSLRYVFQDLLIIGTFAKLAWHIPDLLNYLQLPYWPNLALKAVLWNAYWFSSGCVGMGLWVIAHECGHGAFSENKQLNDFVGWIFHSIWMVPYHSWRISHGRHHAACGHHERDEVFVARTRSELKYPALDLSREDLLGQEVTEDRQQEMHSAISEAVGDMPIVILARLILHQVFGLPLYLILNASGQKAWGHVDHYRPSSKIFKSRDFWDIIWSDIGIALVIGTMTYWANVRGWQEMVAMWMIPYMWVNQWLVLITFLQHTDPLIPHYSAGAWTFPRGALTTVDRNVLGFVGPYLQHGISETHVAHHISSKIPHYNAWEATEALKKFLGDAYVYSNENVFVSLWKNFHSCQFVEDTGDIRFFKDKRGCAKAFPVLLKDGGVSDSGIEIEEPIAEFYPRKEDEKKVE
jgi:omega-6 fatty acid desaturase (delta-12 desaturase)